MRVLIDTTYVRRGPSGTAVYLERLQPALEALGVEVVAVADKGRRPPAGGGIGSVVNLARDTWWTHRELPRLARRHAVDVLHHPLPALSARTTTPQAITVHDLAFLALPEHFDPRFARYATITHGLAARRADAVIAVSHTTAAALEAAFGVRRVTVAQHGPGQEPTTPRAPEPAHFLYVGDDEPRKNLKALRAAHKLYASTADDPLPLVVAGGKHALRPGAAELADLYARAAALVHPSLHEGFGLTPLEAMAAGTPVLALRSAGVIEVCDDAALYADDTRQLSELMRRVATDPALRAQLSDRGRARAQTFSWARSARAHVDAYAAAIVRAQAKRH